MKDSEVEWIGEVPSDWGLKRLKYTSTLAGRIGWQGLTSEEYKEAGPYLITGTDFKSGRIDWESCVHITYNRWAEATQVQITNGDLLITKDGTVGKVAMCEGLDGLASLNSGVMVIRPRTSYSNRFLFWLLQSSVFWGWFNDINAGNSTINHLYQADFYNFYFYLPPSRLEQEAIASKLDKLTSVVDRAVHLLEREISSLQEYKRSLIHETITKGLTPDVPMKPTGVPWIGDIPADWQLVRQSTIVTKIGSGKTPRGGAEAYVDNGVPLIRSQNIYAGKLHLNEAVLIDERTDAEMASTRVKPGDVLLNITGASIGRSCVVPAGVGRANVNQHVCIIRPVRTKVASNFLNYLWSSVGQGWIFNYQVGATREAMNFYEIGSSKFPLPSLDEQLRISHYLDEKCVVIDRLLDGKRHQLELLKEQRQSLIFEYVTGKRRVVEEDPHAREKHHQRGSLSASRH